MAFNLEQVLRLPLNTASPSVENGARRVQCGALQLTLFTLLGTGVLAALVAIRETDEKIAFSCALAAAVNSVAVGHYYGQPVHGLRSDACADTGVRSLADSNLLGAN